MSSRSGRGGMIQWHSFWRPRRLPGRQRVGRVGRAKVADRHIKEQQNPIDMEFDLVGGGMVLIDRTVSRRSGSRPGMLRKTDETLNMRGRWTNELDLEHAASTGPVTPRCYLTFRPRLIVGKHIACEESAWGSWPLIMTTRTKGYSCDIRKMYSR